VTAQVIGIPIGTRLMRIERNAQSWKLWIATTDYKYGTYILCYDNGAMHRITERPDEGPEIMLVKGEDGI
jgi:hypothetical protein